MQIGRVVRGGMTPQTRWLQLRRILQLSWWPSKKLQWQGRVSEMYKDDKNIEISKEKLLPLHWMHCSCFSSHIYVEETPEQCCLATTTHKKLKRVSAGTGTQVRIQVINKCSVKMTQKELYNARNTPWGGGRKNRKRTL